MTTRRPLRRGALARTTPTRTRTTSILIAALAATTIVGPATSNASAPSAPAPSAPASPAPVEPAPATDPAAAPPVEVTLDWQDCDDGFQCATLTVPLDYAVPDGGTIDLSLIRKPATNPDARIGSLLTNPGGPGGSGVDFARSAAAADGFFAPLNERFDIVSWDPRGTKASSPIDCLSDEDLDAANSSAEAFPDPSDRDTVLGASRAYIDGCVANAGEDLLAAVSTENTARDMDLIRAGLGEEQISYLGFSYGTYLGATYASLFPDRLRAFVLDGAVDPRSYARTPIISNLEQARGFEVAIDRFFGNCAAEPCQFQGGKDAWHALADQLEATPLTTGGDPTRPVTGASVVNATLIVLYVRQLWPLLDQALADAAAGDGALLQALSDAALGRNPDGTYDAGSGAFPAITAIDQSYPSNIAFQDLLYYAYQAVSPSFGASTFWASIAGGYSAFEWPVEADAKFSGPFRNDPGNLPIVVVGTTFDPATPYSGSVAMTRQLRNATLLTMDGDGHTAYGGNSTCIDETIDAYFVDLVVPAPGARCQQELTPAAADTTAAPATDQTVESSSLMDDPMAALDRFAGVAAD
jgi:pimeloyl-ACP methyl ester carboxylesterase